MFQDARQFRSAIIFKSKSSILGVGTVGITLTHTQYGTGSIYCLHAADFVSPLEIRGMELEEVSRALDEDDDRGVSNDDPEDRKTRGGHYHPGETRPTRPHLDDRGEIEGAARSPHSRCRAIQSAMPWIF
jgi:hypothetical protein